MVKGWKGSHVFMSVSHPRSPSCTQMFLLPGARFAGEGPGGVPGTASFYEGLANSAQGFWAERRHPERWKSEPPWE